MKIPVTKSYHCSPKCFSDTWQHHRVLHERAANTTSENGAEDDGGGDHLFGRLQTQSPSTNGPVPIVNPDKNSGETWYEVGRSKTYTPMSDDIGHVLRFECVVLDVDTRIPMGTVSSILTSRVIPAPTPTPRRMIPVLPGGAEVMQGGFDIDGRNASVTSMGTFTVLSYNILAETYATGEGYNYCPSWALSWTYRRQNLLREIVGYHADIICLQEVSPFLVVWSEYF